MRILWIVLALGLSVAAQAHDQEQDQHFDLARKACVDTFFENHPDYQFRLEPFPESVVMFQNTEDGPAYIWNYVETFVLISCKAVVSNEEGKWVAKALYSKWGNIPF